MKFLLFCYSSFLVVKSIAQIKMKEKEIEDAIKAQSAPTGGDLESNQYQARVAGEEAVGGQTPTPGQNDVDQLGQAAGIEMSDSEPLPTTEKLENRDDNRWELDSDSADDH